MTFSNIQVIHGFTLSMASSSVHIAMPKRQALVKLDILLDNSAADFGIIQSLQTYPTTGILLDLLEHAVHHSTILGPSTGKF